MRVELRRRSNGPGSAIDHQAAGHRLSRTGEPEGRGVPGGRSSLRAAEARLRGGRLLGDEAAVHPGQLSPCGSELQVRLITLLI